MNMRSICIRIVGACLLLGCVSSFVDAQDEINPFALPKKIVKQVNVAPASPLNDYEFRGAFGSGDDLKVYLYNKKEKKGVWLQVGVTGENGLLVSNFDAGSNNVVVRQGTQSRTVSMNKSVIVPVKASVRPKTKVNPMDTAAPRPQARPAPQPSQSDEEVRARMQKVAEEIRKRREMRRSIIEEGAPDKK